MNTRLVGYPFLNSASFLEESERGLVIVWAKLNELFYNKVVRVDVFKRGVLIIAPPNVGWWSSDKNVTPSTWEPTLGEFVITRRFRRKKK